MPPPYKYFHIGFDDTDSGEGMCTTYLAYCLARSLIKRGLNREKSYLLDYPNLVRLNPNIPWKTRGNAALALRLKSELDGDTLFRLSERLLRAHSTSPKANSGLVMFEGKDVPPDVRAFSQRALHTVLGRREAFSLIERHCMRWLALRSRQGIVGAIAAIGNTLEQDHTFELIAYRRRLDVQRRIDPKRVIAMDRSTRPGTFSNYDAQSERIMIMPHGPDPVLCGIRGETPASVRRAFNVLLPIQNLGGWMIFRSNQGTGEHLKNELSMSDARVYNSGFLRGVVDSKPRIERGGHVFFELSNRHGRIQCACYQQSRALRWKVLALIPRDEVEVAGGIRKPTTRHPKVLNIEYLLPLKLAKDMRSVNPSCPRCSARMGSRGRDQGFECRRCGFVSTKAVKKSVEHKRSKEIEEGEIYLPPIDAQRHLTKPLQRLLLPAAAEARKIGPPVGKWIKF